MWPYPHSSFLLEHGPCPLDSYARPNAVKTPKELLEKTISALALVASTCTPANVLVESEQRNLWNPPAMSSFSFSPPAPSTNYFVKLLVSEDDLTALQCSTLQNICDRVGPGASGNGHRLTFTCSQRPSGYFPGTQLRALGLESSDLSTLLRGSDLIAQQLLVKRLADAPLPVGDNSSKNAEPPRASSHKGLRLAVPRTVIGCLIGQNGKAIEALRQRTSTYIHISPLFVPQNAVCYERIIEIASRKTGNVRNVLHILITQINLHPARASLPYVDYYPAPSKGPRPLGNRSSSRTCSYQQLNYPSKDCCTNVVLPKTTATIFPDQRSPQQLYSNASVNSLYPFGATSEVPRTPGAPSFTEAHLPERASRNGGHLVKPRSSSHQMVDVRRRGYDVVAETQDDLNAHRLKHGKNGCSVPLCYSVLPSFRVQKLIATNHAVPVRRFLFQSVMPRLLATQLPWENGIGWISLFAASISVALLLVASLHLNCKRLPISSLWSLFRLLSSAKRLPSVRSLPLRPISLWHRSQNVTV